MLEAVLYQHGVLPYLVDEALLGHRINLFHPLLTYASKVPDSCEADGSVLVFHECGFHANAEREFRAELVDFLTPFHRALSDVRAKAHHFGGCTSGQVGGG